MAVALVGFLNGAVAAHLAVWLVGLCPVSAGTCRYQLARTGVSFPARRDWSVYWPQGAGEVRAGELCAGQVRVGEVGVGEVGAGQIRAIEIGAGKPGTAEVCAGKVRADERGGEQIRPGQDRAGQDSVGKVRAGQVRVGQVNRIQVVLSEPAPDHGDGGLHVGPWRSLPVVAARIGWRPVLA